MPTLRQSTQVAARVSAPYATEGNELVTHVTDFVVPTGLVANDVIEMGALPGNALIIDVKVAFGDLDSNGTPTITFDAGLISGVAGKLDNTRTCGNTIFAASTAAQAGGLAVIAKPDELLSSVDNVDRGYGLKVVTGAATLDTSGKRIVMAVSWIPFQPLFPTNYSAT